MTANPTLLSMPLAQNGQKNVIPTTQATAGDGLFSQSTGFPAETSLPLGAGGVAPSREDFNGMANLLGGVAYYAQKGWQFQFDAGQEYFAGCIVRDTTDGKLYECLNDVAAGGSVPSADSVSWKAFSTGGVPVGFIMPYAGTGIAEGWLDCDGSAISRTMYPDLFAAIGTTWGAGDGSTTFNLPTSEDLVLQGASATNPVGTYKSAGLPNITGALNNQSLYALGQQSADPTGASALSREMIQGTTNAAYSATTVVGLALYSPTLDASRSNAIYGASDTVQPPAACVRFMIKAFDGQTPDSALIDVTQYAADLANKATRSLDNLNATGEQKLTDTTESVVYEDGFAIIYPNGGTKENPANVTINSTYIEPNPFPGYYVMCIPEIYSAADDLWECPFDLDTTSGSYYSHGIEATQKNDDTIAIVTGTNALDYPGNLGMNTFSTILTTAPCRIKLWKVGKI